MKRSKFSEEQIVYAIRQAESGTPVGDLCRQLGVSDATFYAWKKQYAHLGVSELRRLRQVEEENSRLKRLVADLSLDKHMLSEALRKKSKARPPSSTGPVVSGDVLGQLCAGLSLGAVWSGLLVLEKSGEGSIGTPDPHSRSGSCAASIWVSADLGVVASRGLASKEPRPSGRGFLEEAQLFSPSLLRLMKPNVLLDHIGCHFVTHRPNKIPIFPKLSTPQLLAHFGESRPNLPRTDRLQQSYHLPNRVLRREAQKHMHMVFVHFQLLDLKPMMRRDLQKQFPYTLPHRALQHPLAILGCPHQMIAGVVDTVAGTPESHTPTLQDRCCLRQQAFFLPALPGGASKGDFS